MFEHQDGLSLVISSTDHKTEHKTSCFMLETCMFDLVLMLQGELRD